MLRDEAGYTLVELLIVLAIMGIVVNLTFIEYRFFQQNVVAWQERATLEENARRVINALTGTLLDSRAIITAGDDFLTVRNRNGKPVAFKISNRALLKNRRVMHDRNVTVKILRFDYFDADNRTFEFDLNPRHISRIRITLSLNSDKRGPVELATELMLRNKRHF